MPIYEFFCGKCAKKFDTLVLGSDEEINCVECGSRKVERLFSTFTLKSDSSIPGPSDSSSSPASGCGCTPITCGCGMKN